jgi:hypothetical protein
MLLFYLKGLDSIEQGNGMNPQGAPRVYLSLDFFLGRTAT